MPNIVGISTCKGRLEHVKQSSKSFLDAANNNVQYLLVDYNCPEKTGQWVLDNYPNANVLSINNNSDIFHKTVALNAGAKYAINTLKADYLMFFDADTIVRPGFFIDSLLKKDRFIITTSNKHTKDLTGFIIIPTQMFRESGGYEESFRGWGAEDLEFRIRLYAKHKYSFDMIEPDFLSSIPHESELRVKNYPDKDQWVSNGRNVNRMKRMFNTYRDGDLKYYKDFEDGDKIGQLLGDS